MWNHRYAPSARRTRSSNSSGSPVVNARCCAATSAGKSSGCTRLACDCCIGQHGTVVLLSDPVFEFELTRRAVDHNRGWNVVDDRAQLALARSQQILGSLPILDVGDQVVPANKRTVLSAYPYR